MSDRITIDRDFSHAVGGGHVNKMFSDFYFVKNSDLDVAHGERVIWDSTGVFDGFLSAAETIEIVSDNTNDTSAGSGARSVSVEGILANGDAGVELVTMNGTTVVETVNTYSFIRRLRVQDAGTVAITALATNGNTGLITATAKTSSNIMNCIVANAGVSALAANQIPANHKQFVNRLQANIAKTGGGSNPVVTLRLRVSLAAGRPFITFFEAQTDSAVASNLTLDVVNAVPIPAGSTWVATAQTDTNSTSITGTIFTVLEKV